MNSAIRKISVTAPARLHFGFLDPDGTGQRRFGSVGLALSGVHVRLSAERASVSAVSGAQAQRAQAYMEAMQARCRIPLRASIRIDEAIPEHAGLGSGTQLGIAVGIAVSRLYGLNLTVREVAAIVHRGNRSGIGIGAFEAGGFLVDGGRGQHTGIPPVVARVDFPPPWRVVLVCDRRSQGLHGAEETAAFGKLPRLAEHQSEALCRRILMQALPAAVERDFDAFSEAIGELQRVTGEYFAPAQGGRYSSGRVAEVLGWFERHGVHGVGQSSWGPTGFGLVRSQEQADRLVSQLRAELQLSPEIGLSVCGGRNEGGEVEIFEPLSQPILANARRG
jgi:beta-ribofuranosylaminobenzene 5'-phosphate synthase